MEITFNTGRQYTSRGQVITARFDPSIGKVWFNDHSRMVDGAFEVADNPITVAEMWRIQPESFARAVMRRYDAGGCTSCPTADWRIARDLREGETIHQFRI